MSMPRFAKPLAGALVGFALMTGAAAAASAVSTTALNVRSGPGVGYHTVDVLYRGERVEVDGCRSGWCRITHRGPDGWVSARYLANAYPERRHRDRWDRDEDRWHDRWHSRSDRWRHHERRPRWDYYRRGDGFSFGFSFGN